MLKTIEREGMTRCQRVDRFQVRRNVNCFTANSRVERQGSGTPVFSHGTGSMSQWLQSVCQRRSIGVPG